MAGIPRCSPLKSVDELLNWQPIDKDSRSTVHLNGSHSKSMNRPLVLVCHDMNGGYLEQDVFVQGILSTECYRFWHWWHLDIFVYFSHHFVTIPPMCWLNAAHRHSVLVLGTFITEWDDGRQMCEEVLESVDKYTVVADKLVEIALFYGFDGWLLNIENVLDVTFIESLRGFIDYLTKRMHSVLPHSRVIWYDSIINSGELKWQNELNDQNRMFFDVSDAIFLNYTWKEENLAETAQLAKSVGRLSDVYVGVDVFGRGSYGGGGFNTSEAVTAAMKYNLSSAIFAPGWVYEKLPRDEFVTNENKFWDSLKDCTPRRIVESLPLVTNFCRGWGEKYYLHGQVVMNSNWTNLAVQQLQPTESYENGPVMNTTECAYMGGQCLQVTTTEDKSFVLFEAGVPVSDDLFVSYTFQSNDVTTADVKLVLTFQVGDSTSIVELHLANDVHIVASDDDVNNMKSVGPSSSLSNGLVAKAREKEAIDSASLISCESYFRPTVSRAQTSESFHWSTRKYDVVGVPDGFILKRVSIAIATTSEHAVNVLLGEIQVVPKSYLVKVADVIDRGYSAARPADVVTSEELQTVAIQPYIMSEVEKASPPVISWIVDSALRSVISHFLVFRTRSTDVVQHSTIFPTDVGLQLAGCDCESEAWSCIGITPASSFCVFASQEQRRWNYAVFPILNTSQVLKPMIIDVG